MPCVGGSGRREMGVGARGEGQRGTWTDGERLRAAPRCGRRHARRSEPTGVAQSFVARRRRGTGGQFADRADTSFSRFMEVAAMSSWMRTISWFR